MIASPYHPLGTWVTASSGRVTLTCRVTDVPHPKDRRAILARGIVAEFDFDSAKRLFGITRVGQKAPRDCPVRITPRAQ